MTGDASNYSRASFAKWLQTASQRRQRNPHPRRPGQETTFGGLGSACHLQKPARQCRPHAGILVLEENKRLFPLLTQNTLDPTCEIRIGVCRPAQAQIPPRAALYPSDFRL